MKKVKCYWCKDIGEKNEMKVIEKGTGKLNKNGSEKITRKYFHNDCYKKFERDKEMKKQEINELDLLYNHLISLHNIDVLDGRMMEKIQDLRNGSIKNKGRKITKYKQGVKYSLMLETYQSIQQKIDFILRTNQFETKWNEFSYIFGTMVNNINNVQEAEKRRIINEKLNRNIKINQETISIEVKKIHKKDDLDISDFL